MQNPKQTREPANALENFRVLAMIEPISLVEAIERKERLGNGSTAGLDGQVDDGMWFTCRHWNEQTRLCEVYDQRPWMCRSYPHYEQGCCMGPDDCTCVGELMYPEQVVGITYEEAAA